MLGKLLKYEFKSLMNNLGVLYLVWLSLTLITAVLPKASKYTSEFVENLLYVVWAISFIAAIIMTFLPSDKDIYEREAGRGKGNNNISV